MISQGVGGEKSLPRVQGFHRIMVLQARKASPPRGPADLCSLVAQWHPTLSDVYGNLSMEFSRQEYWGALPFPSPGDFPDPGIELEPRALQGSPALWADSLPSEPPSLYIHSINF